MTDIIHTACEQLLLFVFSTLANTLASISGGGGGFILLPVLIMFGLPFIVAIGTHKCSMLCIGLTSLVRRSGRQSLSRLPCLIMGLLGVPGVMLGTWSVSLLPAVAAEVSLGVMSILIGFYGLTSRRLSADRPSCPPSRTQIALGAVLTFITAVLAGAFSAGTGLFLTMILVMCYNLDLKNAISHSVIFASMVWNFFGAATVAMVASIEWAYLPALLCGSVLGGYLGARLLKRLPKRAVAVIFASVAILSGFLLINRHL